MRPTGCSCCPVLPVMPGDLRDPPVEVGDLYVPYTVLYLVTYVNHLM